VAALYTVVLEGRICLDPALVHLGHDITSTITLTLHLKLLLFNHFINVTITASLRLISFIHAPHTIDNKQALFTVHGSPVSRLILCFATDDELNCTIKPPQQYLWNNI
jgi:hypothetical protein